MELVATVAIGLALSGLIRSFPHLSGVAGSGHATMWLRTYVNPFLVVFAVVQATAIVWGRLRDGAARPMGLGRLTLLYSGLMVAAVALVIAVSHLEYRTLQGAAPTFLALSQNLAVEITGLEGPLAWSPLYLVVGWVTCSLRGIGKSNTLDYREVVGRLFGGLVIFWGAMIQFLWFV
jgi:hypothetical protein